METTEPKTKRDTPITALTDEQIKAVLIKEAGHQGRTASSLGYSRSYISERIKASAELRQVYEDIRENSIDNAEEGLSDLIRDREFNAICFYLKTIGKNRGYVESKGETSISPEMLSHLGNFMSQIYVKPNDSTPVQSQTD